VGAELRDPVVHRHARHLRPRHRLRQRRLGPLPRLDDEGLCHQRDDQPERIRHL
jgi:hypothetical protein